MTFKRTFSNAQIIQNTTKTIDSRKEFVCPEESSRYAASLEQLVFSKLCYESKQPTIIEFGSGMGEPVISALLNSGYCGKVHGYEINSDAANYADELIERHALSNQYIVHNTSFFETKLIPQSDYLIANPPYIPCEDRTRLILPYLCGGKDGNIITKQLLSYGYQNVCLEVSSYADPKAVIQHAKANDYKIIDFLVTRMPFGQYSRQDIVWNRLQEMKAEGKAHFSDNCYLVGSAFFTKAITDNLDLSTEFLTCLTSL